MTCIYTVAGPPTATMPAQSKISAEATTGAAQSTVKGRPTHARSSSPATAYYCLGGADIST
eukprot:4100184-Pyramimonas_sp.AAC.1